MKRAMIALGASVLVLLPAAYAVGMAMMGHDNVSVARHHYVMRNGIGAEYAGRDNPLARNGSNVRAGEKLYEQYCVSCHGASGRGDGPAAQGMNPRPGNIAVVVRMPMATDGYLYWTIAEGGVPVKTAMPPFKGALDEEQIWQLILYLRTM